jgi:hypothetical protein
MSAKVTRISCHKLVADKLVAIFKDFVYGIEKIKALQLDGGCLIIVP